MKNAFSGKQYKYTDSGVFVEYDFSRFIGGYSEWMFIPFDILVFALGACSKERLSNSFTYLPVYVAEELISSYCIFTF